MPISISMCKWFGVHFLIMPLWFPNHFMYMPHVTDAWKGKQPFQVQHSVFNLRHPRLKKCTPYSTSHWGTAGSQKVCFFPEDQYFYPTVLQIQFCSAIPVCHPELPSLHLRPKMDRRVIDWNKMHTRLIKGGGSNIRHFPEHIQRSFYFGFCAWSRNYWNIYYPSLPAFILGRWQEKLHFDDKQEIFNWHEGIYLGKHNCNYFTLFINTYWGLPS